MRSRRAPQHIRDMPNRRRILVGVFRVSSREGRGHPRKISSRIRRPHTETRFEPERRKALSSPQKTGNTPRAAHQLPNVHQIPSRVSDGMRRYQQLGVTTIRTV